jgi:beta-galactosidase
VRLYLNHELIGEKPTGRREEFRAKFDVTYEPGTLSAVGIENRNEVASFELATAGPAKKLQLTADRAAIQADGQDLAFVTLQVTDSQGDFISDADYAIQYKLEGPGSIAAIGSGNLLSKESYQANPRRAYQGRALLVLRSSAKAGKLRLIAHTPGLEPASIEIESQAIAARD